MSTVEEQERLLGETLVTLQEAASLYPGRTRGRRLSVETVRRWTTQGVKGGIVLERVDVGGGARTSIEALHRFFARLQGRVDVMPSLGTANDEARDLAALQAEFNIQV